MSLEVIPLLILGDNYSYIIRCTEDNCCAVIDPGEAHPILSYLDTNEFSLNKILCTHHHNDHIGGVDELVQKTGADVYGGIHDASSIPQIGFSLKDSDSFFVGKSKVHVLETPGHTFGSICFYFPEEKWLFTGDTLFSIGCGRVFEGTMKNMYLSLEKIKKLPDDTLIYPGHEYTENNIAFALTLDKGNDDLIAYHKKITTKRKQNEASIPTSLKLEKDLNPFLQSDINEEVFHIIREKKNRY